MSLNSNLPPDLRDLQAEIEGHARSYGLDFFDTIFEMLDYDELSEIAALGGFPTRYPHWRFGMEYEQLSKGYRYGLQKIYEMVINNDPCYAYLLRCNQLVDQKLVMAHVYGHNDFFKHNIWFGQTNRKMMDEMANHGNRIRSHMERHGEEVVETFIDSCYSLENLIDIHSPFIKRRETVNRYDVVRDGPDDERPTAVKLPSRNYMDGFINPPDFLKEQLRQKEQEKQKARQFPEQPERDVLLFLLEYAPLNHWQLDVLDIIRQEAYYFAPQGQTKIMNEGWACLVRDARVHTSDGLVRMDELVARRDVDVQVHDGARPRRVTDRVRFSERETVKIRTRRGLEVQGSTNHRLLRPDGSWVRLDELCPGDRVAIGRGMDHWPDQPVELSWRPSGRPTLADVAEQSGVSVWTVLRHRKGQVVRASERIEPHLAAYGASLASGQAALATVRRTVRIPEVVDEDLASVLGYLTGDGHISDVKRVMSLTTGDAEQAERFAELVEALFGIEPRHIIEPTKRRVLFSSRTVRDFLVDLGMKTGRCARVKTIPEAILRSPAPVVAAFLRALYDCDGYAGPSGVILATSSEGLGKLVQLLLLNFGILSHRRIGKDECWHIHTMGRSAKVFRERIGFGLERKRDRLERYLADRRWFKAEDDSDEVVAVESGRAEVFDLTVEETHRYAAQGFINHNSYWHSTIMTQKTLHPSELVDYADHHSGTMATHPGRLNPYKVGIELLRDIEERWDKGQFGPEYDECDNYQAKTSWDRQLGLGRAKIFEVRKIHNDVTFIDTFLTPEFCRRHRMFSYRYNDQQDAYEIESREFKAIKTRLLFNLTNFGQPIIRVREGNYRNRGELYLHHEHFGTDLRLDYAQDTLRHLHKLWTRPVHLETIVEGRTTLLSFDGSDHTIRPLGGSSHDAESKDRRRA